MNEKEYEAVKLAENFLSIEGMRDTVISVMMPTILEELKKVGIDQRPTITNTNGVHNQTNTNGVDPIQFPTTQPQPQQPQPQQKLQLHQVMNLLQVLGPYLGPILGLTPANNDNTDSFEKGMRIFSQYDAIKESGKREYVELISTLTGSLTNRTDRDPAEVMGQIAKTQLNNENESSN